jgi:putative addiction module component (TIGR02574 family)
MAIRPDLRDEIMKLPADERLELADELYESVTEDVPRDSAWSDAWTAELRERITAIREGRVEGIDCEQVLEEERARLEARHR